jgi:pimeloyl-ACP methyl ester carboxylesterase
MPQPATSQTTSRDGTTIAFDRRGEGAPLVLVAGAFNDRTTGAALAERLASAGLAALTYDRRGRGASGAGTGPYGIAREVDDLEAVIAAAGGAAAVLGFSSGAVLALEAAARGAAITRLALHDLPPVQAPEHPAALAALIAAGRRGEAVEYFQRRLVGIPEPVIAQLRHAPFRPGLEAMAHTLVHDATLVATRSLDEQHLARVRQPTLAMAGGAGAPAMREVAEALGRGLPDGRTVIVEGAAHDLDPDLLGPVLERFLDAAMRPRRGGSRTRPGP